MIDADGKMKKNVFPTDELLALKCKKGASVDRCQLLKNTKKLLRQKAEEMANPDANRIPWGYCVGKVKQIKSIVIDNQPKPLFKVYPDPIVNPSNPKPWDSAHAIIVTFDSSYTRSQVRGVRDKLMQAFSYKVHAFKLPDSKNE